MRRVVLALALAGTGLSVLPGAAQAQEDDARLRKIESEVRALQRTVFPGGDGRYFSPEVITPGQPASGQAASPQIGNGSPGTPSTSVVTDILGRLDAMEAQLARLTAQTEENTNAIAKLAARVDALEPHAPPPEAAAPSVAAPPMAQAQTPPPAAQQPAPAINAPLAQTPKPAAATPAAPTPAPAAAPTPERLAAVQQIAKPSTDDAGDDEYTYGFRLWDAKFYPEAEQQLRLFVDQYPKHWRMTYARNLLGRAYLDDGKPREAAPWFLQNYQSDKTGERAADSLLYLAESMIAIKDTKRACLALAEFSDVYPALATGRLMGQYRADIAKVKCS